MSSADVQSFIKLIRHPLLSRLYLLRHLPSAYFSGVRIKDASMEKSVITVPYTWFSRNPFRSTYFACLAMAAEMSTGILSMMHVYKRNPAVSMLVVEMKGEFYKKAKGLTTFVCKDGIAIRDAIETAVATGEANHITIGSIGTNAEGEVVAEFIFTWSFKPKG